MRAWKRWWLKEKTKEVMKIELEDELRRNLAYFTGTSRYYGHWSGILYTDGIQYLAEKGECYWLLDGIGVYQHKPIVRRTEFQLWELDVKDDRSALLEMREDTGLPAIVRQEIKYTDFPLDSIRLYFANNVLHLPSEY